MGVNATTEDTSRFGRRMKRKAERILSLEARVLENKEKVRLTSTSANQVPGACYFLCSRIARIAATRPTVPVRMNEHM